MADEARHRPLIVPVFIPHAGCPHRCAFCDQQAITGTDALPTPAAVDDGVRLWRSRARLKRRPLQIAFYGGNFLGLPANVMGALLDAAARHVNAQNGSGIRFSTRPDTITADRLAALNGYPVQLVELGVQSLDDTVLRASGRGHSAQAAVSAIARLKTAGHRVGVQLMVGLPADAPATALTSARLAAAQGPDTVRIYPTVVLRHSLLADWVQDGRYRPWPLEDTVAAVADMARVFARARIPVIRMGLHHDEGFHDTKAIVAGPHHPAFGHLVRCRLFRDALLGELERCLPLPGTVTVGVHPRSRCIAGGWRNATVTELARRFAVQVRFAIDPALPENQLRVDHNPPVSVFSK